MSMDLNTMFKKKLDYARILIQITTIKVINMVKKIYIYESLFLLESQKRRLLWHHMVVKVLNILQQLTRHQNHYVG